MTGVCRSRLFRSRTGNSTGDGGGATSCIVDALGFQHAPSGSSGDPWMATVAANPWSCWALIVAGLFVECASPSPLWREASLRAPCTARLPGSPHGHCMSTFVSAASCPRGAGGLSVGPLRFTASPRSAVSMVLWVMGLPWSCCERGRRRAGGKAVPVWKNPAQHWAGQEAGRGTGKHPPPGSVNLYCWLPSRRLPPAPRPRRRSESLAATRCMMSFRKSSAGNRDRLDRAGGPGARLECCSTRLAEGRPDARSWTGSCDRHVES